MSHQDALARWIQECASCASICTSCVDACLAANALELLDCIRRNLDCANMCDAARRIVTRQPTLEMEAARTVITACGAACRACAEACEQHIGTHDHCRPCADACRRCEQASTDLLATVA